MKKTELDPDSQSTAFSEARSGLNDVFREMLPVLFHKLKNKLTPIIGYSQILKSRVTDDFSRDRLGKIEKNAAELADCLNVMKDYFKPETSPMRRESINRIVEKMKPVWLDKSAENGTDLRFALDPALPSLLLHAGQIELLLQNLVANAMTAVTMKAAAKKEISLSTRAQDGQVKLVLRDNGIGIAADELDGIWIPFYSKFTGGAGLGLVICERIIANHSAECQVHSRVGEYTEFEITFPSTDKPEKENKNFAGEEFAKN